MSVNRYAFQSPKRDYNGLPEVSVYWLVVKELGESCPSVKSVPVDGSHIWRDVAKLLLPTHCMVSGLV